MEDDELHEDIVEARSLGDRRHELEPSGSRAGSPFRVAVVVVVVGALITAACSLTAWGLDRSNEHRLVVLQTRQAGSVISSSIVSIKSPLVTTAELAAANSGDASKFTASATPYVGPGKPFGSMSLWRSDGQPGQPTQVASLGLATTSDSTTAASMVATALHTSTMVVRGVYHRRLDRVAYAVAGAPGSGYAVFAERLIPPSRRVPVERGSAFADLHFATYLGRGTDPRALATTDVAPSSLPLTSDTAQVVIPFGDTSLTLVAAPSGHLGGSFGAELPWIALLIGAVITVAIAIVSVHLRRRRTHAEQDAQTIASLYDQLEALYSEQHSIADELQRALLPRANPDIPGVESAARYQAGADRVDIGGDWFTVLPVDDQRFAFVVGDVSGRGISAATVMARIRFTLRAYLVEGHSPEEALGLCSRQITTADDGHLASVLIGSFDVATGVVTVANAGHLAPLLVTAQDARFVETEVGLPLGVRPSTYLPVSFSMPPGATLVLFTDGLIERRGEILDIGMGRLAEAARSGEPGLEQFLTTLVSQVASPASTDDMAVLALRWIGPPGAASTVGPTAAETGSGIPVVR